MANLSLGLLGSFRLETSTGVPVLLPTKRAKALLAYLALHPGKPQARSKLAALLWEDSSDDRALASLRQTLSALRKAAATAGGDLLITRGDSVLLASNILDVDVDRFEHLIGSSKPTDLEAADGLYQGEFLEGFELRSSGLQRWIRAERERLHEKELEGLTKLLAHTADDGRIERGIRIGTRLLMLDPLRESVQRTLMELYCKQGRYVAALHQYRVCAELLAKELGVEPEPATKALYRDIREQRNRLRNEARTAPAAQPNGNAAAHPDLPRSLERRQLTVLVCSLTGLGHLSVALDPEEASALIGEYHRNCSEIVSRYGGVMDRFSASEMLLCFGYPQADEFDAEEAVHAGLALVEAVTRLDTGFAGPLQLHVGIASGSVICGDLVGHGMDKHGLLGEAVELAAGLQAIAEPNAVVIAASTRQLVGGFFDCDAIGPIALKGAGEAVSAWRVTGASTVASRFEALRAGGTPLVGREEEMEVLLRRWQQAKGGEGRVVLLSGEPGIGKSRLAAGLLERLTAEPHVRLRFFCSPHRQESALYPVITHLNQAAGFQREDTVAVRLDKLEALLSPGRSDLAEALPLIADLLTVPTDSRCKPLDLSPQQRKQRTLATLVTQVEGLAADQPVMMLFEDAHWSDPTSLELMDLLVDRVSTLPMLVVVTFRPEFASSWVGRPHVTSLNLSRLSPRHCIAVIAGITDGKVLPKELADQITEQSDGVPLFIEELTRAVLETGVLVDVGDRYMATRPLPSLAIPTTLEGSLLARLDRLASARETAQIGAALGRRFSHELIAAVAAMPPQQLEDSLARLEIAELLYRRGTPPDAEYTFKHALVQNTAYGSLLRSKRQQLHARIAEILEKQFTEVVENQPEVVARHYTEAGLIERAASMWGKAGQRSLNRSAPLEAVAQLTRALDQSATLSGTPTRRKEQIKLQLALATALMHVKGYSASEPQAAIEQARLLIEQAEVLGDVPEDPLLLFSVLYGFWVVNYVAGNATSRDVAAHFLSLAMKQNATAPLLIGNRVMGHSLFYEGNFVEARMHYDRGIALYNPAEHRQLATRFSNDSGTAILSGRASTLWALGYANAALTDSSEALKYARSTNQASSLAFALFHASTLQLLCGNYAAAAEAADELSELADVRSASQWKASAIVHQGCILAMTDRACEALETLSAGIIATRSTGQKLFHSLYLSFLAKAHVNIGQIEDAWRCVDEANAALEATKETWSEAEVHRVAGEIALKSRQPDTARAEAYFERAVAVARQQQAKSWELRAAMSMARLWRDQGKRDEARDLLAPVYGWFTEGFETLDLKEAKALLDELAA
jgi:DNA-binding SARP family transcriptional activator/predicted ATPase